MKKAQLIHAFQWLCPDCHSPNLSQHHKVTLTEEEIKEAMGLEAWEEVPSNLEMHAEALPNSGTCKCGAEVELIPPEGWEPLEDEDEEGDEPDDQRT